MLSKVSWRNITILLSLIPMLQVTTGCGALKKSSPPRASLQGIPERFKMGQIIDLQEGAGISFSQLVARITPRDLIFLGEVHDNPEHHLIQTQIIQSLLECCRPVAIAVEFLQTTHQKHIDLYVERAITEEDFLDAVNWDKSWGFDYYLYRPIFLLARQHGIKILAVNAPRDIVRKVSRGGLNSLTPPEREQLAREIHLDNKAHRAYIRKIYEQHPRGDLKTFEYFYQAQCAWEDTMAQNISEYLRLNKSKMVVLTGNGHIVSKFGIPDRTVNRFPVSMATVMPYPLDQSMKMEKAMADYMWLTSVGRRQLHGRL
jgi:uncharacterized iron-regulated protein